MYTRCYPNTLTTRNPSAANIHGVVHGAHLTELGDALLYDYDRKFRDAGDANRYDKSSNKLFERTSHLYWWRHERRLRARKEHCPARDKPPRTVAAAGRLPVVQYRNVLHSTVVSDSRANVRYTSPSENHLERAAPSPPTAENGLVVCNAHCTRVQLLWFYLATP